MRFSAAYRSILETVTVLILTNILAVGTFAMLMTSIYPIYFVANLFFGSSTVDFAGSQRKTTLTSVLLILAVPAVLGVAMVQGEIFGSVYFVFAGLTAIESIAFVFCESVNNRIFLLLMLAPRVLFAASVGAVFMLGAQLSLDAIIGMLFVRDIALVLIGSSVLYALRRECSFRVNLLGLRIGEVVYLVVANAHDFVLRIVMNNLLGAAFVKEFEYALRLPKVLQTGLMLTLRHRVFATEVATQSSNRILLVQVITALGSTVVFVTRQAGIYATPFIVIASSFLATSAVPWYVDMLRKRKFLLLTAAQLSSFSATVFFAMVFADPYTSIFFMALCLFLFAFVYELNGRAAWIRA